MLVGDLLMALLGRLSPLSLSAPPMLLHLLEQQGVKRNDIPFGCVQELAKPMIDYAREVTRANRQMGGERRLRSNLLNSLEVGAIDIACILRGTCPRMSDLVDPEFETRVTGVLRRHGVKLPLYAKTEGDVLWELAQTNRRI